MHALFGGILHLVGVQNFKFSGYMTVSGLCMHDFGKFWKILENFLLFTEIPTEKLLQRQIYVQNIQYDVLLRKGGGVGGLSRGSCAISIMGSEHQSCSRPPRHPETSVVNMPAYHSR